MNSAILASNTNMYHHMLLSSIVLIRRMELKYIHVCLLTIYHFLKWRFCHLIVNQYSVAQVYHSKKHIDSRYTYKDRTQQIPDYSCTIIPIPTTLVPLLPSPTVFGFQFSYKQVARFYFYKTKTYFQRSYTKDNVHYFLKITSDKLSNSSAYDNQLSNWSNF